ncbi:MAG: metalloregulator ArsR/SmtB family transcription factor [Bryobacteraceae bacterium]|nr:metalloregulator ArsR/SmtB family transcription factor [Bryobacteraceae bacterium]
MPKRRVELRIAEAALLFAALGDDTRLELLRRLSESGPASISTLAGNFQCSRQAVTKHLQFLACAGIIDGKRAGREHVWMLNPARLAEARRCLDVIGRGWDDALGRLKAHLEDG